MTEPITPVAQEPEATPAAEPLTPDSLPMIPKTRFDEVNTERNQLRDRLAKLESERKAEQERILKEQGDYKTIAETLEEENKRLKEYETQVQTFIDEAKKNNDAFIEQVPEERRGLIPLNYSPRDLQTYLQTNRDYLLGQEQKPFTPPSTNGGAGTYQKSGGQFKPLTAAEQAVADKMNIPYEEYQKQKAAIAQKRG